MPIVNFAHHPDEDKEIEKAGPSMISFDIWSSMVMSYHHDEDKG